MEHHIQTEKNLDASELLQAKQVGISDKRIGELLGTTGLEIRKLRKKLKILPSVFQIDTLAGEFPAKTNYLYLTYNGNHNDVTPSKKEGVIVLGSGPYRIGSSVEFDWTSVNATIRLQHHGKKAITINCNPETVSTDYDISDRLYFEELTFERIADIYEFENPYGIVISVGGQTPNNRAQSLKAQGFHILGTDPIDIERAENRNIFSKLLDELDVSQPAWDTFSSLTEAANFCKKVGYPVLLRPSFVLSGTAMRVCHNESDLEQFAKASAHISKDYPITVSKFIEEAKEVELDAVAQKGEVKACIISEHVENAGVHSGDATIVLPSQTLNNSIKKKLEDIGKRLATALHITGPYNIQFLVKEETVQVIEINLRSSRTFPFISKVTGINFIALAIDAFFEKVIQPVEISDIPFVAVKVAQFSFARLTGADPILHVEMASTGEVACFGDDLEEAFLKGLIAVGGKIPQKGIFISLGGEQNKERFLQTAKKLVSLHLPLFATEKTAAFLAKHGIKTKLLYKIHEHASPNILEVFQQQEVDLAINIVDTHLKKDENDDYMIRRSAIDHNIPLFTNPKKATLAVESFVDKKLDDLQIRAWDEYISF